MFAISVCFFTHLKVRQCTPRGVPLVMNFSSNGSEKIINEVIVDMLVKRMASLEAGVLTKEDQEEVYQETSATGRMKALFRIMQGKSSKNVDTFVGILSGFSQEKGER